MLLCRSTVARYIPLPSALPHQSAQEYHEHYAINWSCQHRSSAGKGQDLQLHLDRQDEVFGDTAFDVSHM